ncbi:hypothetical protein TNCT_124181 [Trichonephila clavata]|uniref:Uncharacterized protein n=1 Tax=Trichonephila clavata TaxID=2740835 RepID=A0A8X6KND8_TRICU|nr:hypothetical protein TNCT_124181 [Trichonephila clavata]
MKPRRKRSRRRDKRKSTSRKRKPSEVEEYTGDSESEEKIKRKRGGLQNVIRNADPEERERKLRKEVGQRPKAWKKENSQSERDPQRSERHLVSSHEHSGEETGRERGGKGKTKRPKNEHKSRRKKNMKPRRKRSGRRDKRKSTSRRRKPSEGKNTPVIPKAKKRLEENAEAYKTS